MIVLLSFGVEDMRQHQEGSAMLSVVQVPKRKNTRSRELSVRHAAVAPSFISHSEAPSFPAHVTTFRGAYASDALLLPRLEHQQRMFL